MSPPGARPGIACPEARLREGAQGLERVAVDDAHAALVVTFQRPIVLPGQAYLLDPRRFMLTGGQRIFPRILSASPAGPDSVTLQLDAIGDFSIYTLTVSGPDIDPFFSSRKLRFRTSCDDRFDCRPPAIKPAPAHEIPVAIDYLTKDYAGFRQALFDFVSTRMPAWTERSEADIGVMILELLAYTADQLSYMQDRVANEAFLDTASQRRSVAQHLALIGYRMDPGAAAHTFLFFEVNGVAAISGTAPVKVTNRTSSDAEAVLVFETLGDARLDPRHNHISLYSWGNPNCCLLRTALTAALAGTYENLDAGDWLLIEDTRGRCDVVRLVSRPQIVPAPAGSPPPDPPLTIVNWSAATPLSNEYCVAEVTVRGNMVPATHGESIAEDLRALTEEQRQIVESEIARRRPGQKPPRQRLRLSAGPLAYLDADTVKLGSPLTTQTPEDPFAPAQPASAGTLRLLVDGDPWRELPTLLDSRGDAPVFRTEIDDEGDATVVFGNGVFGRIPPETSTVRAEYRVGGGSVGNVGAGTLIVARPAPQWMVRVTNPLRATGGRDFETRDHARRFAPATFHKPLVAVTAADYQSAAQAFSNKLGNRPVQRSNASFRWTGSWLTVTLAVDPVGSEALSPELRSGLLRYIETRRLAGYDLEITAARYLPIELAIEFCALPGFVPANVQQSLQEAFGTGTLAGGAKAFFHPDNFTFGGAVYVSRIYAAAMAVNGVESVTIVRLARAHAARPGRETAQNLRQGFLAVGTGEIVQLENNRNFPDRGTLAVRAKGAAA